MPSEVLRVGGFEKAKITEKVTWSSSIIFKGIISSDFFSLILVSFYKEKFKQPSKLMNTTTLLIKNGINKCCLLVVTVGGLFCRKSLLHIRNFVLLQGRLSLWKSEWGWFWVVILGMMMEFLELEWSHLTRQGMPQVRHLSIFQRLRLELGWNQSHRH